MSRRRLLIALAAAGAVQLAVPLWLIAGYERTLHQGTPWHFEAAPVDPADPMRGRYLALRFAASQAEVALAGDVERGQWAYAPLLEDAGGMARLGEVTAKPPAAGDFVRVRVLWIHSGVHVELPFDRLYLPEGLAPAAEARLRAGTADPDAPPRAWAVVRVRDGQAVLEDLMIDGISARGR